MNPKFSKPDARFAALPEGYSVLQSGPTFSVVIKDTVQKTILKSANVEQRAALHDLVDRYSKGGWQNVPRSKFNANEGWFPSAKDKRVRLEAFKPWQLRAYGFCENLAGQPTFFITGVDPSKKQDGANQTILARAGEEAVAVHEYLRKIGGKNVSRS